jgi:hypothetical protein
VEAVGADDDVRARRFLARRASPGHAPVAIGVRHLAAEAADDRRLGAHGVEESAQEMAPPEHGDVIVATTEVRNRRAGEEASAAVGETDLACDARARHERLAEAEPVEHGEPVRLQENARADGARLGDALEERHPRTRSREQQRRRRAADAGAGDDDVLGGRAQ